MGLAQTSAPNFQGSDKLCLRAHKEDKFLIHLRKISELDLNYYNEEKFLGAVWIYLYQSNYICATTEGLFGFMVSKYTI
jgi:hypothetical protein